MKNTFKLAVIASVAVLAACGGGGGGSNSPAPTPTPTPAPTPVSNSTLVTSVASATYPGDFAAAYNLLNAERSRCGFGLLAQNAQLDAAAAAHAAYISATGSFSHAESPGPATFTGAAPADRVTAKGYPAQQGSIGEVMAGGSGEAVIRGLLSAPYHLLVLTFGSRDIGMGAAPSNIAGTPYFVANIGSQSAAGSQSIASTDVATYPCNGTTGVNFLLRNEIPNPIPGRDLSVTPIGTPILFKARDGNALVITNVGMVKAATGAAIALRPVVTAANDPNGLFQASQAYVAPDSPLEPLTKYTVTYSGTNANVPFTNSSFSFTTGANSN